jgi:esterase
MMGKPILHYEVEGHGRPLLILHGLFGSSLNWRSLAREFSSGCRVYRVDLRNHGDSFHDAAMGYADMAGDVASLIQTLGLAQADVLGHSMGGKVAMTLAHSHAQMVDRLIVADIAPRAYSHDYGYLLGPLLQLDLAQFKSRTQADQALAEAIPERLLRQFLLQNLAMQDGELRWKINLIALADSIDRITGFDDIGDWSMAQPALFIRGGNSDYVSDGDWAGLQRQFVNARLETIDGAGHWLHAEKPAEFVGAVRRFLAE